MLVKSDKQKQYRRKSTQEAKAERKKHENKEEQEHKNARKPHRSQEQNEEREKNEGMIRVQRNEASGRCERARGFTKRVETPPKQHTSRHVTQKLYATRVKDSVRLLVAFIRLCEVACAIYHTL